MPDFAAERLIQLNRQAIAMLRLGIPLDLGLGPAPEERLRDINDELIGGLGTGRSAVATLAVMDVPDGYRSIAAMLLAADDPALIFQSITIPRLHRQAAGRSLSQAFREPLVVAFLGYFGLILFCLFTLPGIEAQYADEGRPPAGLTRFLVGLRATMPLWGVAVPALLLAAGWFWKRFGSGRLLAALPGSGGYGRWLQAESQATRLSALVDSETDSEAVLAMVAGASGGAPLGKMTEQITRDESILGKSQSLLRIARFYHFLAERRRRTRFEKLPGLVGVLLAGVIVLAYGLAIFVPWVDILSMLGETGGGR